MVRHFELAITFLLLYISTSLFSQQSHLIWSDEFNDSKLDTAIWNIQTGYGRNNDGWGNNELQRYTPDNYVMRDGCLVIQAKRSGEGVKRGDFTSLRITTSRNKEFCYGRIEARMKMPAGRGVWPAFWMLGYGELWPDNGEIDILEYVGYEPNMIHAALHSRSSYGNTVNKGRLFVDGVEKNFHTYGINWYVDRIEFYVDEPEKPYYVYAPGVKTKKNWPFDTPHYILFNFAVGGNWGGRNGVDVSAFPQEFAIDWVRVYEFR